MQIKGAQELNARLFARAWQIIGPPDLVAYGCSFVMGREGRGEQLLKRCATPPPFWSGLRWPSIGASGKDVLDTKNVAPFLWSMAFTVWRLRSSSRPPQRPVENRP